MYRLEIQKLRLSLQENIEDVDVCIKILKQAIKIADRNGDFEWGVELRYHLIQDERATSKCVESALAFAWILDVCDRFPEQFDLNDYLLAYEWLLCSSYSNTGFSLEQILSLANDLEQRLEACGISKRGYYFTMAGFHHTLGDFEKGSEYIALACIEPFTDEYVEAMEYDARIDNLVLRKVFDEALVLVKTMEAKRLTSFSLPFETFCLMGYALARSNDSRAQLYLDKAKEAFEKLTEINSSMLYCLTRLLYTKFLLKDEGYLALFERIATWMIGAEEDLQYMMARHLALVFSEEGTLSLDLSSTLPFYAAEGVYDKRALAKYYDEIAVTLSAKFDVRNRNDYCSSLYEHLKQEVNHL